MRLDGLKILKARINHRGILQIHYRDQRNRSMIGYIHGDIERVVKELERRGIKVEWDTQIRI